MTQQTIQRIFVTVSFIIVMALQLSSQGAFAFTSRPLSNHHQSLNVVMMRPLSTSSSPVDYYLGLIHARSSSSSSALAMSSSDDDKQKDSNRPFWLDPSTKGGVLVLTALVFLVPIGIQQLAVNILGVDEILAGRWIGLGFTIFAILAWVSSYVFRVASKDMTYVSTVVQGGVVARFIFP